eukprot:3941061-Rhodomonas_salina.3
MCVRPLLIPSPELLQCMLNAMWSDIVGDTAEEVYSQGGLGKLMECNVVENWVCAKDHQCSTGTSQGATTNSLNNEMRFFLAECYSTFLPWGRRLQVLSLKQATQLCLKCRLHWQCHGRAPQAACRLAVGDTITTSSSTSRRSLPEYRAQAVLTVPPRRAVHSTRRQYNIQCYRATTSCKPVKGGWLEVRRLAMPFNGWPGLVPVVVVVVLSLRVQLYTQQKHSVQVVLLPASTSSSSTTNFHPLQITM